MKKGSETVTIKRSEINFNPANIKTHSDEEINRQKKNLRKVGFLGGIVYNGISHNLIDGHRRIKALDIINKYDGTPETDYEVKVEKVAFDEKTEKEQMAFMALANSKADYNLVAHIIDDIDYHEVGLSEEDYERIRQISAVDIPAESMGEMDDAFITPMTELDDSDIKTSEDIIQEHKEQPHMTKEQVKAEKKKQDDVASKRQNTQDLYVFLSFSDQEQKEIFCELLGVQATNSMMIAGEKVLSLIQ